MTQVPAPSAPTTSAAPGEGARAIPAAFAARCQQAACRSCGRRGLEGILDLGPTPLADGFYLPSAAPPPRCPLELVRCPDCTLVQIIETVAPEVLFPADYVYHSSYSDSWVAHCRRLAEGLIERRRLGPGSLVIELASNDGYLLANFVARGIPALGIDPAAGAVEVARQRGVPSVCEFFSKELAAELRAQGKVADVVLGLNVLAHVADTNGFVAGVRALLGDEGVAVFEFPYVVDLIERREFDTIYHEHLCYFSATAIERLFARHGLHLVDVERLPTHGGSLRVTAATRPGPRPAVEALLAEEQRWGVDRPETYRGFAARVDELLRQLRGLLARLRADGKRIAAYGAAAKGTMLLSALGVGPETLEFAVDRNPLKHGRLIPGAAVPVAEPARVLRDMPDYLLILPWNLEGEIVQQQAEYHARGGRFIVPLPTPRIV